MQSNSTNATSSCDVLLIYVVLLNNIKYYFFWVKHNFKKIKKKLPVQWIMLAWIVKKIQQWHVNASCITGELNPPGHNSAKVNLIHLSSLDMGIVMNSAPGK